MTDIRRHERVLETLTGRWEKPALVWLAERMPAWVTPDVLTALGLVGSALVFAGYVASRISPWFLWLASVGLVVNWLGDSADGTLARVRHVERPRYGFYVDHTVDVVSEAFVFLGLGASPYVDFRVACLAFSGYLAMEVLAMVRTCVDGRFRISYSRLGPTEGRIALALVNAVMFAAGTPHVRVGPASPTVWDLAVGGIALLLAALFVSALFGGVRDLARIDATGEAEA